MQGGLNPSDDLTKADKKNGKLVELITSDHFYPPQQDWVERNVKSTHETITSNVKVDNTSHLVKQKIAVMSHKFRSATKCLHVYLVVSK